MARFNIPKKEGFLCVGVITQAHSLHGEVLVKTFLDDNSIIDKGLCLTLVDDTVMEVQKVRPSNKGLLVRFTDIKNRNEAEAARKTYLYLNHEEFPQEDDDEIYYFELKEYKVFNEENEKVGKISDVLDNGVNTVIEVRLTNPVEKEDKTIKKVLIPFSNDMVLKMDKDEQFLVIDQELFDIYVNL